MFKSCLKLKNNWVQKTKNFSWIISSLFVRSKVTQPIKKRIVHKVDWIFTLSLRLSTASLADIMALARKTTFSWLVLFVIILLIFLHCAKSLDYLDYTDCWDDLDCEEGDCCYGDILGLPGFCASCGITLRNFDGKENSRFCSYTLLYNSLFWPICRGVIPSRFNYL